MAVINREQLAIAEIRKDPVAAGKLETMVCLAVDSAIQLAGYGEKTHPDTAREFWNIINLEQWDATPGHIATFLTRVKAGHYEFYGQARLADLCRYFREFMVASRQAIVKAKEQLEKEREEAEALAAHRWALEHPEEAERRKAEIAEALALMEARVNERKLQQAETKTVEVRPKRVRPEPVDAAAHLASLKYYSQLQTE